MTDSGIVRLLFEEVGVKVAVETFFRRFDNRIERQPQEGKIQEPDGLDAGESAIFIARQRFYQRIELAYAKWSWLRIATYFHPTLGKANSSSLEWDPTNVSGQFTTADFAGRQLPHEAYIGDLAQSQIRLNLLHGTIAVCNVRENLIQQTTQELLKLSKHLALPPCPWHDDACSPAWISLVLEVKRKRFDNLPSLNSYCGFKNLWSVQDTPANGVHIREMRGVYTPNLFAYAASVELTSCLIQVDPEYKAFYRRTADSSTHALPHQWALRKATVKALRSVWNHITQGSTPNFGGRSIVLNEFRNCGD